MGLITFVFTLAGGAVIGWILKGKVDKKPEYRGSKKEDLEEE